MRAYVLFGKVLGNRMIDLQVYCEPAMQASMYQRGQRGKQLVEHVEVMPEGGGNRFAVADTPGFAGFAG